MKILIIGAGGVGTSMATIIKRAGADADWATKIVMADYNLERAKEVAEHICGLGQLPTATQREQVLYASSAPER